MKFPMWLDVYGDQSFRGKCPPESAEQITFFSKIRREYPDTWGRICLHPRNEGQRRHAQTSRQKAEGMCPGAADIIIPGAPSWVCELKRQDHTKCKFEPEQLAFLEISKKSGACVGVALGWVCAWEFFLHYIREKS